MTDSVEDMAALLHKWYLEAIQKTDPENYNPKAAVLYEELNEQQKEIDRYIAAKVIDFMRVTQAILQAVLSP